MKNLNKLVYLMAFTVTSMAHANPIEIQAGDISAGAKYHINPTEMLSYYKTGKSGNITFTCILLGQHIVAVLYGGKNFSYHYDRLVEGANGPFNWTLHDQGADVGNIRVLLLYGEHVTVQCKQL